jgi:hypothetical protein
MSAEELEVNGSYFRKEMEKTAEAVNQGTLGLGDPAIARRMRLWAAYGEKLINHPDHDSALRYLVALHASLSEQHVMNNQALMANAVRSLKRPLWICTLTLIVIALGIWVPR